MQRSIQKLRNKLFGAAIAGAILFGGTQAAVAAPSKNWCDSPNVKLTNCPLGTDCGWACSSGVGECGGNGCCYCQF